MSSDLECRNLPSALVSSQHRLSAILGPKACISLARFQVPKPMLLLSGLPQPSVFPQPSFSAFSHFTDSAIPECLSASTAHPFCLSGTPQLFSCLPTATVTAVSTRAACSPLLPSRASASSLCISSSGHPSNGAERRR